MVANTLNEGRYELQGMLGQGGMATVWRAYDNRLEVHRAIKVLLPQYAVRDKLRQRFHSEARTMAKLHHPNITTVHDVGEDGDQVFMVMELVEGGSLHDRLKDGPLAAQQASDVMQSVLAAMAVAHSRGVVHRDIKPHNILISAEGVPKVTDFGIAQLQGHDNRTKTGAVMGTLAYMSPEQQLNSKGVDARADVYALGVTLYTLVRGVEPTDSLYVSETHATALAGLPDAMAAVIKKATRYRPEDRFQTVEAFRDALRSVHRHLGTDEDVEPLGRPLPDGRQGAWGPTLGPDGNNTLDVAALADEPESQTFSFEGMLVEPQTPVRSDTPTPPPPDLSEPDPVEEDPAAFTLGDPSEAGEDVAGPTQWREEKAASRPPLAAIGGGVLLLVAAVVLFVLKPWANEPEPTQETPAAVEEAPEEPVAEEPAPEEPAPEEPVAEEPEPAEEDIEEAPEDVVEPVVADPKPAPVAVKPAAKPAPKAEAVTEPVAAEPAQPEAAVTGTLMLNSLPWSNVTIDGQSKGTTDWKGDLPAGKHNVVLTTSDGRVNRTVLDVTSGDVVRWCWDFDKGAACSR